MSRGTTAEPTGTKPYWVEAGAGPNASSRFRAKIGGLHCSLCTGTIEKALGQLPGVAKVAVSLTHEQALVEYDPSQVSPDQLLGTLKDIGYTIWDPRKARPFDEEEAQLVTEGRRLLVAIAFSLMTIGFLYQAQGWFTIAIPAAVTITLGGVAFLLLRGQAGKML